MADRVLPLPLSLHPCPGQRRVEGIALVEEDGAHLQPRGDGVGAVEILRPQRRGEAEVAVIDERDGGFIVAHLHHR